MPLVKEAGIDPIYFGVMFIINCSIGLITPPIGNVLKMCIRDRYIVKGAILLLAVWMDSATKRRS